MASARPTSPSEHQPWNYSSRPGTAASSSSRPCSREPSRGRPRSRPLSQSGVGSRGKTLKGSGVLPQLGSSRNSVLLQTLAEKRQQEPEEEESDEDAPKVDPQEKLRRERQRRAAERQAAKTLELAQDQQRYSKQFQYNGLLIDYCVRQRNHPRTGEACKLLLDPPQGRSYRGSAYRDGIELVHGEKLLAVLKRLIVYCYKSLGDPAWKQVTHIKTHFWQLVQFKKEFLALDAKVENWNLMFHLKKAGGRESKEDPDLRRSRLVGFWAQYHTSHKLVSPQKPGAQRGVAESGHSSPNLWRSETSLQDDPLNTKDEEDAVRLFSPKGPDRWKLRSSHSKRFKPASLGTRGGDRPGSGDEMASTGLCDLSQKLLSTTRPPSKRSSRGFDVLNMDRSHPFSGSYNFGTLKSRSITTGAKIPKRVDQAFKRVQPARSQGTVSFSNSLPSTKSGQQTASTPNLPSMTSTLGSDGSLREKPLFAMPHRKATFGNLQRCMSSPTHLYLRACDDNFVLPSLMPFCSGDSDKLIGRGQSMSDHNLRAVTEMFENLSSLQQVDLEGNANLTEKSLAPFVRELFRECAGANLESLSLKQCLRNATGPGIQEVMDCVVSLIDGGVGKLKILDLSGIPMGLRSHLPLCQVIKEHAALEKVQLAEVGLGRNPQVKECLTALLASKTITTLDVSWNSFSVSIFTHLGERAILSKTLRTLSVANCSAASKNQNNPVEFFVESLAFNKSLTSLDLSLNRIDFRGALVMEAALEQNKLLTELSISNNPLCVLGFRSALRLLSRAHCGLLYLYCENCISGSVTEAADESFQVFSATNPGGRYMLNLSRPYDRALLTMLYKACEHFHLPPEQAFSEVKVLSRGGYSHPSKSPEGVWLVPKEGRLDVTFNIETALEKALKDVPDTDFSGFLHRHYEFVRITPDPTKIIPIFHLWKSINGRDIQQFILLDALSKDFLFTYPMVSQICKSRAIVGEITARLLPCIKGSERSRYLSMLLMPSLGEYLKLITHSRNLLVFNIDNPTGHYELDLANCCDFAVGEQLLLLDRWEFSIARRKELEDTSQRGIRSQVRNEMYQGKSLQGTGVRVISEFNMPEYGTLEFDYISSKRPPQNSKPINDGTFADMLTAIHAARCDPWEQIKAVTMVSHYFYMSALQMRALLGIFQDTTVRAEFLVRLFLRLTDMYNEKIFRARFEDRQELLRLQHRLGHVTFFPFIQPEQATFELDFSVADQRLAMYIFMSITAKEARDNVRDYSYTLPDGTVDQMILGIPRSWDLLDKIPKVGVFRAKYNSAPEDRNFKERTRLMERYGFWRTPDEQEVMWWSSIQECPTDVVEFVEFIYTHYHDIWVVFKIIDGDDGNGQITLREFEEGIEAMKCKKFKGANKSERIKNVFRYLDPSGEGQVSEGEWGVLEQLFNEIQLSIQEFVQFCERTFGENLMDAWDRLDADGSGEIDKDEWKDACSNLGFFGLMDPIFSFLDKRDVGGINEEDFQILKTFQKKQEGERKRVPMLESAAEIAYVLRGPDAL